MCNEFLKHVAETVARRCFFKKMLLKISQNSQENTCAKSLFLIKLQATTTFLKRRLWRRCFPVNFPEFLRTPFLQNTFGWLLLKLFVLISYPWSTVHIPFPQLILIFYYSKYNFTKIFIAFIPQTLYFRWFQSVHFFL